MKQLLTLFSAVILLHSGDMMAKPKHVQFPAQRLPAGVSVELVNRALSKVNVLNPNNSRVAQKTTATERLATQTDYDYTQPPTSQFLDSLRFIYSNSRGSAFDIQSLEYDIANSANYPSPALFGVSYINFDTVRNYPAPGSSSSSVIWRRSYNAANKVVKDENDNVIDLFEYDGANRVTRITGIEFNSTTGGWDSSYRDFYKYNSSGYLVLDSGETWTAGSWDPQVNYIYANDASGRPAVVNIYAAFGPGMLNVARFTITYPGSSVYPSVVLIEGLNSSFVMENYQKDTVGYSAGTIVSHDSYQWDPSTSVWVITEQERRHLNSASLPDSVFTRSWNAGIAVDSSYRKLAYNSSNNPTYSRSYGYSTPALEGESRWYYEPVSGVGVKNVQATRLEFYPNPASDKIQLKGLTQGNYVIYNTTGQVVQSGKIQGGGVVPVQSLSPGMYSLGVQNASGQQMTATFVRQ